jgi:hypothetical protein
VKAKSYFTAVVVGQRQNLLVIFFSNWALKADSLMCLLCKICAFLISRISRLLEKKSTTTYSNKFI